MKRVTYLFAAFALAALTSCVTGEPVDQEIEKTQIVSDTTVVDTIIK